jgi:hypothetical protein
LSFHDLSFVHQSRGPEDPLPKRILHFSESSLPQGHISEQRSVTHSGNIATG